MGEISRHIRAARLDDIEAMQAIERAAGHLFADIGMDDVAAHPPLETAVLAGYVRDGRAWIAEADREPRGYAITDVVDGRGHLEQVSVHPAYGRQGLGRMLIQTVFEWAIGQGLSELTLLTFRDVPWNGPYYASLGFHPLPDEELPPELMALRNHESDLGLDRDARFAMYVKLPAHTLPVRSTARTTTLVSVHVPRYDRHNLDRSHDLARSGPLGEQ
ncbi:MAG TPA: GNAT family N-acetyltransferase [Chloroflexota bacterium]|jgi:GNAT superfamily N-acetyltransferase